MLACARLGAVHSVVFGGFAANELATRIDDASPSSSSPPPAASRSTRSSPTSRCSTPRSIMAVHKPESCIILQRPMGPGELMAGRDIEWDEAMAAAATGGLRAGRRHRSALHPLHLRHDRPAQGRGARQWRPCGGAGLEHGQYLRRRARRGVLDRLRCRLGGRPFLHRLCAAAAWRTSVLYEGKPVGTPDAGAFWRVIAEHEVVTLFTAPTAFRAIKRDDPDGKLIARPRPLPLPRPVPGRRAARTRRPWPGPRSSCGCR